MPYLLLRYKRSRYGNSDDKMKMYTTLMSAYGASAGIQYRFDGTVANTLQAHRVIQHYQEEKGPKTADEIINGMTFPIGSSNSSRFFRRIQVPS